MKDWLKCQISPFVKYRQNQSILQLLLIHSLAVSFNYRNNTEFETPRDKPVPIPQIDGCKQNSAKCYWIKKPIQLFYIHSWNNKVK